MSDAENEFSMNWTMIDAAGVNVQVTVRRPKLEDWPTAMKEREKIMDATQKTGWTVPGTVRATVTAPSAAVAQPARPQNVGNGGPDWSGHAENFMATSLEASISKGKTYWKVKGGRFTQFGVTIWPEVLAETGLKPDPLKPPMDLTGWTAHYINNPEGKPDKVIKLMAPVKQLANEPF